MRCGIIAGSRDSAETQTPTSMDASFVYACHAHVQVHRVLENPEMARHYMLSQQQLQDPDNKCDRLDLSCNQLVPAVEEDEPRCERAALVTCIPRRYRPCCSSIRSDTGRKQASSQSVPV